MFTKVIVDRKIIKTCPKISFITHLGGGDGSEIFCKKNIRKNRFIFQNFKNLGHLEEFCFLINFKISVFTFSRDNLFPSPHPSCRRDPAILTFKYFSQSQQNTIFYIINIPNWELDPALSRYPLWTLLILESILDLFISVITAGYD